MSGLTGQVSCGQLVYKCVKWLVIPSCKNQAKNATCETEAHLLKANKANTCYGFMTVQHTPVLTLPFWKPALAFIKDSP